MSNMKALSESELEVQRMIAETERQRIRADEAEVKLAKAEAACAEMRSALTLAQQAAWCFGETWTFVDNALLSDVGKDCLSAEQSKLLIERLEFISTAHAFTAGELIALASKTLSKFKETHP